MVVGEGVAEVTWLEVTVVEEVVVDEAVVEEAVVEMAWMEEVDEVMVAKTIYIMLRERYNFITFCLYKFLLVFTKASRTGIRMPSVEWTDPPLYRCEVESENGKKERRLPINPLFAADKKKNVNGKCE